ncbi:MAG: metallophosphoesterase [Bacteroidales bacterium]|nr:metallophosphoesterase [Bacteroidales bacterium]
MKYLFFLVVLLSILSINSYVFIRGWKVLPPSFVIKTVYAVLFWALTILFFVRMFYGDSFSVSLSQVISAVAFTWLIAVVYFALIALGVDFLRLIDRFFVVFPSFVKDNPLKWARITVVSAVAFVSFLLLYGSYKFNNPQVKSVTIEMSKPLPGKHLRVVLVSDIHLSSYINGSHLDKYVEMINSQNPHVVLIAGDIVDRNLQPLIDWDISSRFKKIESKYGVFAVSGNHEYYGGERESLFNYLRSSGITLLLDSVAVIGGTVQIAGREDRSNLNREELKDILKETDKSLPIILMDHQPFGLNEAIDNGVDLQLSGHTHNGQFWPGSLIVKWMYQVGYGYKKIGGTHFYVSSGVGLWGPKFRIGTASEVVTIDLKEI